MSLYTQKLYFNSIFNFVVKINNKASDPLLLQNPLSKHFDFLIAKKRKRKRNKMENSSC